MEDKELIRLAHEARKQAYVPYSNFSVGAALCTSDDKIYLGCNIENASYGACNCAERTAFFKAVSEGEKNFAKIAIVGGKKGEKTSACFPYGICRQVMSEFCDAESFQILIEEDDRIAVYHLSELLPKAFENV